MTDTLIPPDRKRCQAETHQRAPFMQMGGPPVIVKRCKKKPNVIARETAEPHGEMSLCNACLAIATKQLPPNTFTTRPV